VDFWGNWDYPYVVYARRYPFTADTSAWGNNVYPDMLFVTVIPVVDYMPWVSNLCITSNCGIAAMGILLFFLAYTPFRLMANDFEDWLVAGAKARRAIFIQLTMMVTIFMSAALGWNYYMETGATYCDTVALQLRTDANLYALTRLYQLMTSQLGTVYYFYHFKFFEIYGPNLNTMDAILRLVSNMNSATSGVYWGNTLGEYEWYVTNKLAPLIWTRQKDTTDRACVNQCLYASSYTQDSSAVVPLNYSDAGTVFCNYDPRYRPWYAGSQKNGGVYFTKPYAFANSGDRMGITGALALFDVTDVKLQNETNFLGVIGVDISTEWLNKLFKQNTLGENGEIFITDTTGALVAATSGLVADTEGNQILAVESASSVISTAAQNIAAANASWDRNERVLMDDTEPVAALSPFGLDITSYVAIGAPLDSINTKFIAVSIVYRRYLFGDLNELKAAGVVTVLYTCLIGITISFVTLSRVMTNVVHIMGIQDKTLHAGNDVDMQTSITETLKARKAILKEKYSKTDDLDDETFDALDKDGDGIVDDDEIDSHVKEELELATNFTTHSKTVMSEDNDEVGDMVDLGTVFAMMSGLMTTYRTKLEGENLVRSEDDPDWIDVETQIRSLGSKLLVLGCRDNCDIGSLLQNIILNGESHWKTQLQIIFTSVSYKTYYMWFLLFLINTLSLCQESGAQGVWDNLSNGMSGFYIMELIVLLFITMDLIFYTIMNINRGNLENDFNKVVSDMQEATDIKNKRRRKWSLASHNKAGNYLYLLLVVAMIIDYCIALAYNLNTTNMDPDKQFRWSLFFRPICMLVRMPSMWRYVYLLTTAMFAVKQALYLYLCVLLIAGCQSVALFAGVYDTDDWQQDQQFQNFYSSFITMFIYTSTGENFNEAVNPALVHSPVYGFFFAFYTFVGMFFVTSLVVAIFQNSYNDESEADNSERFSRWSGTCCCFAAWATGDPPENSKDQTPRLDYVSFVGILKQCYPGMVKGVAPDMPPDSPFYEFEETELKDLFHFLDVFMDDDEDEEEDLDSMDIFDDVVCKGEHLTRDCAILKQQVDPASTEGKAIEILHESFCVAMQMDEDMAYEEEEESVMEQIGDIRRQANDLISQAQRLKLKMQIEGSHRHAMELEELVDTLTQGMDETKKELDLAEGVEMGVLKIDEFERLNDVLVVMHAMAANDILLSQVKLKQITLEQEELAAAGNSIRDSGLKMCQNERALQAIEFRIEALHRLEDRQSSFVYARTEGSSFLWVAEIASKYEDVRQLFFMLLLVHLVVFSSYGTNNSNAFLDGCQLVIVPFFVLELLISLSILGLREYWFCNKERDRCIANRVDLVVGLMQFWVWCKWMHIYVTNGSTDAIQSSMESETYHVNLFILSLGLVRIITSSRDFRKIVYVGSHSIVQCGPIAITLATVIICYSALACYLFQGLNVASDTGNLYFSTIGISMFTHFQLFIGEGWHDIMYGVAALSTSISMYFFISYIILVTLLFGNLFLGVIIDIYNEVEKVQSINLHETLEITFGVLSSDERRAAFGLLCDLLDELGKLPDPFGAVTEEVKYVVDPDSAVEDSNKAKNAQTGFLSSFRNSAGMYGDTSIGVRQHGHSNTNSPKIAAASEIKFEDCDGNEAVEIELETNAVASNLHKGAPQVETEEWNEQDDKTVEGDEKNENENETDITPEDV